MSAFGEFEPGCRGDAGLSDTAFTAEKKNAHVLLQIGTKADGDWFVPSLPEDYFCPSRCLSRVAAQLLSEKLAGEFKLATHFASQRIHLAIIEHYPDEHRQRRKHRWGDCQSDLLAVGHSVLLEYRG
jgi:hypothetical protein